METFDMQVSNICHQGAVTLKTYRKDQSTRK
jgi:hypothetical protein